jgi:hypothetical protein
MFVHNALHFFANLMSNFLMPVLFIASIGLFCVSLYDLIVVGLSENGVFFSEFDKLALINFADPLHVLIGSALLAFLMLIASDFGVE